MKKAVAYLQPFIEAEKDSAQKANGKGLIWLKSPANSKKYLSVTTLSCGIEKGRGVQIAMP
jgi:hypothetical protein